MSKPNAHIEETLVLVQECQDLFALLESETSQEELDEALIRKKVVRGRKLVRKLKCTNPNQILVNGTCKNKTAARRISLKKAKRKEVRTKKADVSGKKMAIRKMKKSIQKRKAFGLTRGG
ncbi:MAG: hypothetical protein BV459_04400 [Thermoplasmata archaeon M11B2D]|nr:MAG: hypothetical protein BV459_04400 [Thermoplasmata archaeon M11B2D]